MDKVNELIQIRESKLKRLLLEIHKLRPDHYLPDVDWEKMNLDDRKVKLASLIAMRGFTDKELKTLYHEVTRVRMIRITWIHIVSAVLLIVAAGTIIAYLKYKQFSKIPKVYAYGNEVPVYDGPDSSASIYKRIDLFGVSLSDTNHPKTGNSMRLLADSGDRYMVSDAGFFTWWLGHPKKLFVRKKDMIDDELELADVELLFLEFEKSAFLLSLNVDQRRAIQTFVKTYKERYWKSSVSNSFTPAELGNFKPFVTAKGPDGEEYIFLSLLTTEPKHVNLRITMKNGVYTSFEEIQVNSERFLFPLMWNDSRPGKSQTENPIIEFREKKSGPIYQNSAAPYDNAHIQAKT